MVQIGGCRCCSEEAKAIQKKIDLAEEGSDGSPEVKAHIDKLYAEFRAAASPRWVRPGSPEYNEYMKNLHQ